MLRRTLLFLLPVLLVAAAPLWAREKASSWLEVRSEHFTVVTNAGEGQGRHVADQLERMRLVFRALFPKMNVDPAAPITVLALKNEKDFQQLEPAAYLGKGKLNLAGYFLRAPDMNLIMLRLDAQGDHPYATVYHEYTHLEVGDAMEWMPLWLNEGLAEFIQNTELEDKTARLGEPNPDDLALLQQNRLIPLATLFKVGADSPYYHEEQKGSIFYAESWALTHYLETGDAAEHTHRLQQYVQLVAEHQDPVTAAESAFGDLKRLEQQLESYTSRASYQYFRLNAPPVNEAAFQVVPLAQPDADAIRADFLAHNGRTEDARALLASVLQTDAKNVKAHESMGYLEFRAHNNAEAKKWFGEAVALDSQSYMAAFYFGVLSIMDGDTGASVEASLRRAIQLNPRFAPAYDTLASLYGRRHENLDEAHRLSLQAVELEPSNVDYRLTAANLLMEQQKYADCVMVLQAAEQAAKTPQEARFVQERIDQVQQIQAGAERARKEQAEAGVGTSETIVRVVNAPGSNTGATPEAALAAPKHPTETPHGKMLTAWGVLRGVTCSYPAMMELQVEGTKRKLSLYTNNYYELDYRAGNYTPNGEVHPCQDLEGTKAEVEYFVTADKTVDGQIVAIMMMK